MCGLCDSCEYKNTHLTFVMANNGFMKKKKKKTLKAVHTRTIKNKLYLLKVYFL